MKTAFVFLVSRMKRTKHSVARNTDVIKRESDVSVPVRLPNFYCDIRTELANTRKLKVVNLQ